MSGCKGMVLRNVTNIILYGMHRLLRIYTILTEKPLRYLSAGVCLDAQASNCQFLVRLRTLFPGRFSGAWGTCDCMGAANCGW